MLTREDNELLTRVGPGTPLGQLMRHYWMPVVHSSELAPGGHSTRVKLLGEDLEMFSHDLIPIIKQSPAFTMGHREFPRIRSYEKAYKNSNRSAKSKYTLGG